MALLLESYGSNGVNLALLLGELLLGNPGILVGFSWGIVEFGGTNTLFQKMCRKIFRINGLFIVF